MKKENRRKRIISLLLAFSMLIAVPGCGKGAVGNDAQSAGNQSQNTAQTQDGESGGNAAGAMGRYVETETDLSDRVFSPTGLYMLDDGSFVIPDIAQGLYVSKDNGNTWSMETPDWLLSLVARQYYISEIAVAPDGTAGVLYDPYQDDDYTPVMELILPDGTQVPVEIELTEDDEYIRQIVMTKDSRIIVHTLGGNLYEVHKDGRGEPLVETAEYSSRCYIEGNLIVRDMNGQHSQSPSLYDMETGAFIEDKVLADFVMENYGGRYYNGDNDCTMYILPDDETVLYLIGAKGIHRHVVGGNLMEQVVDGALSMLSNPSYTINAALALENDEFLVLFSNNKLIRYTYDPNVPTVPENVIKIYSLREDEDMRQAVSMYQSRNPGVFVSYEIGIEDGSSMTRDDAVKKLNTEIMAGTGPDLIVMDDLPLDSYVEKGLLLDLTDYLQEYSEKEALFDNIIEALKIDGKAYVAPATFHIPMLIGEKDRISGLTDLSKVGEAVEELRREHPGDDIVGICSADGVMKRFAAVSAPEWITEDGALNREMIGEFIEQCKRIYDAQMDGIRADIVEAYERQDDYYSGTSSQGMWRVDWAIASDIFEYISGEKYLLNGWVISPHAYNECISVEKAEGFEDSGFRDMQGQCSQVFKPNTLLGINAASAQTDNAKAFMDFFLSSEAQADFYSFPLNKEAYDIQYTPDENYLGGDRTYSSLALVNEEGVIIVFTVYFPEDAQIAALKDKFASLNTAYIPDSVLEDAVFDGGSAYMEGTLTLEEALDEIEKQVAIYMAE